MKRIINIILNAVLVLLMIIGISISISLIPSKNNIKILAVLSGSMEPNISTGDLILIRPASEYKVRDVISFNPQNAKTKKDVVTHRIVDQKQLNGMTVFTTKGDANDAPDIDVVYKDQIIGKHVFSVALVGYLLGYIKTLPGLLIVIFVPAIIIIYEEINKIKKEALKIIEEREVRKQKLKKQIKKIKKAKNEKNST